MITSDAASPFRRNCSSSSARTPLAWAFPLTPSPVSTSVFTASAVNAWTAARALTRASLAPLRSNCAWLAWVS